jgi:hypothetical protein
VSETAEPIDIDAASYGWIAGLNNASDAVFAGLGRTSVRHESELPADDDSERPNRMAEFHSRRTRRLIADHVFGQDDDPADEPTVRDDRRPLAADLVDRLFRALRA